jgi:tRNA 2-thiocytidine biosynthesis protein TtcA
MASLKAKLSRGIGTAITDYGMIEAGDTVAVAVSGGKDSLTLLDILVSIRRRAGVKFDLVAVTVDQGYDGFRWPVMEKHFRDLGVPYHIENTHIRDTIEDHKQPGATWCSLCARLRRGVLYRLAREKGWSSIALGHHADDLIESHLLSQLFNGATQSMPPVLRAKDGYNKVIRPMCYVWERHVIGYTEERGFPVICCACPACRDHTLKRQVVKALLHDLEERFPGIKTSLLSAQRNLKLTQLMDPRFLPMGEGARLKEAAMASPLYGILQNEGVSEEPEEERREERPEAPALLTIGARPAAHAPGMAAAEGNGGSARPRGGGSVRPVAGISAVPATSPGIFREPAHESPGSCGAMCGCGPQA